MARKKREGKRPEKRKPTRAEKLLKLNEAFYEAAREGNLRKVRELHGKGADVNFKSSSIAPIHAAAYHGHGEVVEYLLKRGADLHAEDLSGWTPLVWAVKGNHVEIMRHLLEKGAEPSAKAIDGSTPLHHAAEQGYAEAARHLLDNGADINARSKYGSTPLHIAASKGHAKAVKLLVAGGADLLAQNRDGKTPVDVSGNPETRKFLSAASAERYPGFIRRALRRLARLLPRNRQPTLNENLRWAAGYGELEKVRELLRKGAHVNATDEERWAPLHYASLMGRLDVVKHLLENGANLHARSKYDWTPLHDAATGGHIEVAKHLLASGADPRATNEQGKTPADVATGETMRELLEQAARSRPAAERRRPLREE